MKIKLKFNSDQHNAFTMMISYALNKDVENGVGVMEFYTLHTLRGKLERQQLTSRSPMKNVSLSPCEGVCVASALTKFMTWLQPYEMATATQALEAIHLAFITEVAYIKNKQAKNQQKKLT